MLETIQKLENTREQLDYTQVSWINKHFIIDLQDKADVLLNALESAKDEKEFYTISNSVDEFVATVQPVILQIEKKEL